MSTSTGSYFELNADECMSLFLELDNLPGTYQNPQAPDWGPLKRRIGLIEEDFADRFGECFYATIEDSVASWRVTVLPECTEKGSGFVVWFSNFGDMASVVVGPLGMDPGKWDDLDHAVEGGALSPSEKECIETSLRSHGFVFIPKKYCTGEYDGRHSTPHQSSGYTWWERFFSYT
ncbi:hypothetical protein [Streptomyces sp. NPDC048659]|uniref:hypothetical protein n=1 Tax=Streptomyces sp. NPDC048659 TaxID=3155489 RepID=UPI003437FE86